jgi:hypothetical protein
MCTNSNIIYSDKESIKMKKRRRRDLAIGISMAILLATTYMFFSVTLIIADPLESKVLPMVLVMLSWPLVFWIVYYIAVKDGREALEHGVVLTDDALLLWGEEIPLDHVLKAEVADFHSGSHFLAIGYVHEAGKKRKTKATLLWPKSTEDIWELCNDIRCLRGWTPQLEIQMYGHWGWSQWKDQLKKAV